jgi:hypothetical protein
MEMLKKRLWAGLYLFAALALLAHPLPLDAQSVLENTLSKGQTVYVPIYSHVYSGPKETPFQLSAMVSIRNTDPVYSITILKADYYNTDGRKLEGSIKTPLTLKPLAATDFTIKESDVRGGTGASFLVTWRSDKMVNQPIIQGVMLGLSRGQGISFICPGQILVEHPR